MTDLIIKLSEELSFLLDKILLLIFISLGSLPQVNIMHFLNFLWRQLERLLSHLDPSLFQNIIIGILAIFIPFAIVFLDKDLSHFEKLVLINEVFDVEKIYWISIIGITIFAFSSGSDISVVVKIINIVLAITCIILISSLFSKVLLFARGDKSKFELQYLEKLSTMIGKKDELVLDGWSACLSDTHDFRNEYNITQIFISHMDTAIEQKNFVLAYNLATIYTENMERRKNDAIIYIIFPKILEWNEKTRDVDICKIYQQTEPITYRGSSFLFVKDLLQKHIKKHMNEHHLELIFNYFEVHMQEIDQKLKDAKEKEKDSLNKYLSFILKSFLLTFFQEIEHTKLPLSWIENRFPKSLKINSDNKNKIAELALKVFMEDLFPPYINSSENNQSDINLEIAIQILFPKIYSKLFKIFLVFHAGKSIQDILSNSSRHFYMPLSRREKYGSSLSQEEQDLKNGKEELLEKQYMAKIIVDFFPDYTLLIDNEDYIKNDDEIKKLCEYDDSMESRRKDLLELISLITEELERRKESSPASN